MKTEDKIENLLEKIRKKDEVIDAATELYQYACTLMRYQDNKNCWHNLQNSAMRFNAIKQRYQNET